MENDEAEWGHAIERYINPSLPRKPNATPLAELLKSDKPVPKNVRLALAEIIRPTEYIRPNYKIALKHTKSFDKFWRREARARSIAHAVAIEVESGETVEKASESVSKQLLQW